MNVFQNVLVQLHQPQVFSIKKEVSPVWNIFYNGARNVLILKCLGMDFWIFTCDLIQFIVVSGAEVSMPTASQITPQTSTITTSNLLPVNVARRGRRKSACYDEGCYILDPIPTFTDDHKNLVIQSWHFVSDHISEVGKTRNTYMNFI